MNVNFKKQFLLNQRVKIDGSMGNEIGNAAGVILGKSFENVFDEYIVLLDNPTKTHLAVTIPETLLTECNL